MVVVCCTQWKKCFSPTNRFWFVLKWGPHDMFKFTATAILFEAQEVWGLRRNLASLWKPVVVLIHLIGKCPTVSPSNVMVERKIISLYEVSLAGNIVLRFIMFSKFVFYALFPFFAMFTVQLHGCTGVFNL